MDQNKKAILKFGLSSLEHNLDAILKELREEKESDQFLIWIIRMLNMFRSFTINVSRRLDVSIKPHDQICFTICMYRDIEEAMNRAFPIKNNIINDPNEWPCNDSKTLIKNMQIYAQTIEKSSPPSRHCEK